MPKHELKIFDENSEEFAAAMRKISPELLRLLKDQFQTAPSALLSGIFEEKSAEVSVPAESDESFDFSSEEIYED